MFQTTGFVDSEGRKEHPNLVLIWEIRVQMLQPGGGDFGIVDVKFLQIRQFFEMLQSGIGDLRNSPETKSVFPRFEYYCIVPSVLDHWRELWTVIQRNWNVRCLGCMIL